MNLDDFEFTTSRNTRGARKPHEGTAGRRRGKPAVRAPESSEGRLEKGGVKDTEEEEEAAEGLYREDTESQEQSESEQQEATESESSEAASGLTPTSAPVLTVQPASESEEEKEERDEAKKEKQKRNEATGGRCSPVRSTQSGEDHLLMHMLLNQLVCIYLFIYLCNNLTSHRNPCPSRNLFFFSTRKSKNTSLI